MKEQLMRHVSRRGRHWLAVSSMVIMAGCGASRPAMEDAPASYVADSPLVGARWELTLFGTDEWWQGERKAYFTLLPKGKILQLVGSDGCNTLQGEATLGDGRRLAVSDLATTRMACPGLPQSPKVAELLSQAYRYLLDHDRLVLMGRDGHVLGGFKRQG
ncbi:META domain-containing protein [Halomonas sp. McH1-25]|uniref:META domain-containing protein n=1 Tax=unclassified Halomonas TaxID=2609666 RepID=UPI001EF64FCE|nr:MULTISPECIES: META domain-containing protein [unclassified Halomonas]MCG7601198.1 META domain-containing protein [Halomonas sp. McH1-25]MCP1341888.1 META domain-containing protein [Halomonas sp. FL8]MCP1360153.1 META domain-containing protein [Halomonas sp. BBD45]